MSKGREGKEGLNGNAVNSGSMGAQSIYAF